MTIKTKFNIGDMVYFIDWTSHCIRKAIVEDITIIALIKNTDITYVLGNKRYAEDDLYGTPQDAVTPLLVEDKIKFVG